VKSYAFKTKLGWVGLSESAAGVSSIRFIKKAKPTLKLSRNALKVREFLDGSKADLDSVKVDLGFATTFTRRILLQTRKIPAGETRTYGWLARKLKTSPRAVGQALKKNPVPVVIPCHRVVGSDCLGGFSAGINLKSRLLKLESK